jgi:RNA polymerase sigma-70 factor (ECF subfamily)
LVGEYEAEDLTQEVFIRINHALKTFRGESQLSTWIYRIATNAAIDRMRSPTFQRNSHKRSLDDPSEQDKAEVSDRACLVVEKVSTVEQQLMRKEMNQCIRGYVDQLPENYRTVLVLNQFEGLRNHEIAEILGVTLDTVKIRLHRARDRLKQELWAHCDSYWLEDNEFVPDMRSAVEDFPEQG